LVCSVQLRGHVCNCLGTLVGNASCIANAATTVGDVPKETDMFLVVLLAMQVPAPCYNAPQLPPAPEEVLPEVEAPQLQEAQLQLQPEPLLMLGWCGGPDDGDINNVDSIAASAPGSTAQQQQQAGASGNRALSAAGTNRRDSGASQSGGTLQPQKVRVCTFQRPCFAAFRSHQMHACMCITYSVQCACMSPAPWWYHVLSTTVDSNAQFCLLHCVQRCRSKHSSCSSCMRPGSKCKPPQ
jgi:hypothetical protein